MKNVGRYFFSVIVICMFLLTPSSLANEEHVSTESEFLTALSDESIDTIILDSDIMLQTEVNTDDAFFIDKEVTIKGGELTFEHAGLVLGANVTFENITLGFANPVRNGIFANGNTLTLNGVSNSDSVRTSIHLFCGGITGYNGANNIPTVNSEGKIIIKGNNDLGYIFAGSLADDGEANKFTGSSTIIIEADATGISNIYARGIRELRGEGDYDGFDFSSKAYIVSGNVNITLNESLTINIDGDTGTDKDAVFTYNDTEGFLCAPQLVDMSEINLIKGNLVPAVGSSLSGNNVSISVADGSTLSLVNFGNNVEIGNLLGGGELILGKTQLLTIAETVSGNTNVSIELDSSEQLIEGQLYIIAPNSQKNSFSLISSSLLSTETLIKDDDGNWTIAFGENRVIVEDITVQPSVEVKFEDSRSITIPFSVTYENDNESNSLDYVPIELIINDKEFTVVGDSTYGYSYTLVDDIKIEPFFLFEDFILNSIEDAGIPAGTYTFEFTIPQEYMADGIEKKLELTLTILQKISVPTPITGLKYNREEQVGVLEGVGYTVTGNKEVDAGNYVAVVTLLDGYQWDNETTDVKNINWSIEKADGVGTVSLNSWIEGETAQIPVVESSTNDVATVTYQYKEKDADDTTYTDEKPSTAGTYIIKATFLENTNYNELIVYSEFSIASPHVHYGGTATCTTLAICTECGQEYGSFDENVHNYGTEWDKNETTHWYECECGTKKDEANHVPGHAATETTAQICTECGYVIKEALGHTTHIGGTATCTSEATCSVCGQKYGTKDDNNHTGTTEIRNAVEATSRRDGYTGDTYYKCCNKKIATGKVIPAKDGSSSGGGGGGSSSSKSEKAEESSTNKSDSVTTKNETNKLGEKITKTMVTPTIKVNSNAATLTIPKEIGDEIANQAKENKSDMISISSEIEGYVDSVEISIFTDTLEKIAKRTSADLDINTPVANILVPNEVLEELSASGEEFLIFVKKVKNNVEFGINVDNDIAKNVGDISLFVPLDNCSFGTVAFLENNDGTKQIIQNSIVDSEENVIEIPLTGAAKLSIEDNSKKFNDIKENDWYFNAIQFASAHKLFGGTSDTHFSPNDNMTRGMVAQVLHNLENNPKHNFEGNFSDVENGAWYENAINWACDAGIISGYGNDMFGPKDEVSREQLAVMLWKYSGSPKSNHKLTYFVDMGFISEYAKPALAWANENKIITGKGAKVLDPIGKATRAEVAQMLKNFIEKIDK